MKLSFRTDVDSAPIPQPLVIEPPPASRRWLLHVSGAFLALVAIGVSLYLWPQTANGYGPVFWLWVTGLKMRK